MGEGLHLVWELGKVRESKSYGEMLGVDLWGEDLGEYSEMALDEV